MLPKLHEEAMALPSEEEFAERKRPEQPALATFAMPDVPPAPTPAEPAAPVVAPSPKAAPKNTSSSCTTWAVEPLLRRTESAVQRW